MKQPENTLLADIREVNLSYLLLAQRMLRDDYAASMFRLGFSEQVADILMHPSPARLVKLACSISSIQSNISYGGFPRSDARRLTNLRVRWSSSS